MRLKSIFPKIKTRKAPSTGFKKLKLLIIELNDIEEECDKLYLAAMRDLTKNATEIIPTIAWHEIYDCLEACVDTCEYVSESIDTIVMKNT